MMIQLAGRLYQGLEHAWWTNDSVLVTWVFTSKSKLSWLSLMCMPASDNRSFWMEKWLIPQFPSISQFFWCFALYMYWRSILYKASASSMNIWISWSPMNFSLSGRWPWRLHQIFEHLGMGQTYLSLRCVFFFVIFAGHHHKNGGRHFGF